MRPKSIELHIEELVLDGLSRHGNIKEAVETELSRMLGDQGLPQLLGQGGEIESLEGGSLDVKENSRYDVIGAAVARSIYGGLKR
ncbi:Uncharacterised protein [uncultured archaeon]|nr:Uncharacterised protein [uncultured archaeon]